VADIIRALADSVTGVAGLALSAAQRRVLRRLAACRTASLGGHIEQCDRGDCAHERIAYNSCRDRHCPKCQTAKRARWFQARRRDLLPARYFHVVFTVPAQVGRIALQNKRVVYGILFRAASETLLEIAADARHLGARIGFVAVLHTWTQTLLHHPHVHCIVPGGGLSPHAQRWICARPRFFLSVRVLGRLYRGKFLDYLGQAYRGGELRLTATLGHLRDPQRFAALLRELRRKKWVVYAKPPAAGPEAVLGYLARYTHRVAIANSRLVSLAEGAVRFRYKDRTVGGQERILELDAREFLRRFLLHVLPGGFVRIRHYGLLANAHRRDNVELCRSLIGKPVMEQTDLQTGACEPIALPRLPSSTKCCPRCGVGTMITIAILRPGHLHAVYASASMDSS